MNKKNKYSVLMSVYKKDSPEYLQIALKSIYEQQSIKPDEIVIVVDGPIPENLREVLDSFKKDKEKIVKIKLDKNVETAGTQVADKNKQFKARLSFVNFESNIPVVVEGVESEKQVNFLKSIGAEVIQGYYFSKPIPTDEYEKLIEE